MFAPFTILPTSLNGHLYWFPPPAAAFAFPNLPPPPSFASTALSPTMPTDENADPNAAMARPTPQYHCKQCDRVFKSARELQEHCTKLHERLHECAKCVKTFSTSEKLDLHIRKKHTVLPLKKRMSLEGKENAKPVYQCERCDKRYETYYNYREHMQKHDGKVFECSQCGKRLSGQSALSRHSKIHNKPHECAMCSERFSSAYDLDCHFSYYHSTFKRFRCQFCDRALYNYSGKLRHQRLCPERPIDVVKVD
uniref:C2H2-type domain-containing protein n=1 Tax=Steinernema glaseri TaxID=37863 RepID=A0A1I7XXB9_9BILA